MRGGWRGCIRLTLTPVSNVSNMREVQERSGACLLACILGPCSGPCPGPCYLRGPVLGSMLALEALERSTGRFLAFDARVPPLGNQTDVQ